MSDQQRRGKKRPKSYYIKCARQKKHKINSLEPGICGFLVTCNKNEKRAVQESYSLLNEYADAMLGPEKINKEEDADVDSSADDEEDIEKALQKEVQEIKKTSSSERRFQNIDTKCTNVIFIRTTIEDPASLMHSIFSDIEKTQVQKTRFAIRMLPISGTCKANISDIEKLAKKLFLSPFETPLGTGLGYSTLFKSRNNGSIKKEAVVLALGHIIKLLNPLHYVNYTTPDYVVLVEILKNVCCVGIAKDFYKFRKYNLHEIVKPAKEEKGDKEASNNQPNTESSNLESCVTGASSENSTCKFENEVSMSENSTCTGEEAGSADIEVPVADSSSENSGTVAAHATDEALEADSTDIVDNKQTVEFTSQGAELDSTNILVNSEKVKLAKEAAKSDSLENSGTMTESI